MVFLYGSQKGQDEASIVSVCIQYISYTCNGHISPLKNAQESLQPLTYFKWIG